MVEQLIYLKICPYEGASEGHENVCIENNPYWCLTQLMKLVLKDFGVTVRQIKNVGFKMLVDCVRLASILIQGKFPIWKHWCEGKKKKKNFPCQCVGRENNFPCQHPGARNFFLSVLTLAKTISACKMCLLNSDSHDLYCCCCSPQAESSAGGGKVFSDQSVHKLWLRSWRAAVKLGLYGTGACETCVGPGLTSKLHTGSSKWKGVGAQEPTESLERGGLWQLGGR